MAKKETTKKETKEVKELTPEEKEAKLQERLEDNFSLIKIALRQKEDGDRDMILKKLKGKVPQAFIDEKIKDKEISQKNADLIKELGFIGAVRTSGGKKSVARPWRYQIETPEDGPTGKALIAIEEDLAAFEKKHEDNLATVSQWYKDNEGVEKTFSTYFAKKVVKEKKADGKSKSK